MIAVMLHVRTYAQGDHQREEPVRTVVSPRLFPGVVAASRWLESEGLTSVQLPLVMQPYTGLTSNVADYDSLSRPVERHVEPVRSATAVDEWGLVVRLVQTAPLIVPGDPDKVPDIGDRFTHRGRDYCVSGWLRRRDRTWMSVDYGPDRCALEFCERADAQYVAGSGVSGVIARVAEVRVTGRVTWSPEALELSRASHAALVGQPVN